jgi:hypothetical protein
MRGAYPLDADLRVSKPGNAPCPRTNFAPHPEVLGAKRRASKGEAPGAEAASFEARAEPVIGPATSCRTRWRGHPRMRRTSERIPATHSAPESCLVIARSDRDEAIQRGNACKLR